VLTCYNVLTDIQRIQAPEVWEAERSAWRTVIHLNLVRAVNTILDVLQQEVMQVSSYHGMVDDARTVSPGLSDDEDFIFREASPPSSPQSQASSLLTNRYAALRLQFAPLRRVEEDLRMILGAAADEVVDVASSHGHDMVASPFDAASIHSSADGHTKRGRVREFFVWSHTAWKSTVNEPQTNSPKRGSPTSESTDVIATFRGDIKALWRDDAIRAVLSRQKVTLQDSAE
jgi:guanine nucleotide-binding protein alpha-1 subunit